MIKSVKDNYNGVLDSKNNMYTMHNKTTENIPVICLLYMVRGLEVTGIRVRVRCRLWLANQGQQLLIWQKKLRK